MQSIIIGIDPGTKATGYGIIKKNHNSLLLLDYGVITPSAMLPLSQRYFLIFQTIDKLIEKYQPTTLSIETQFVKKNPQIALKLGMARGACIIAAAKHQLFIYEYAPKQAKLAVVGTGSASKEQVHKMIQMLLHIEQEIKQDAADALSLAICHAHREGKDVRIY